MRFIRVVMLLVLSSLNLPGELVCEEPSKVFPVEFGANTVKINFLLKNKGKTAIQLRAIRPSCSCIVTSEKQPLIQAGHDFILTAEIGLKNRDRSFSSQIAVDCDGDKSTLVLEAFVDIPKVAVIYPTEFTLKNEPVSVVIRRGDLGVLNEARILDLPKTLTADIKKSKEEGEVSILVARKTPVETKTAERILIEVSDKNNHTATYMLNVYAP